MVTTKDVVCDMTVDVTDATPHVEYEDTTYYFCCAGCAKAFSKDPAQYLNQ